jgi:hypothetical protein
MKKLHPLVFHTQGSSYFQSASHNCNKACLTFFAFFNFNWWCLEDFTICCWKQEGSFLVILIFSTQIWFFIACFTSKRIWSERVYSHSYKEYL